MHIGKKLSMHKERLFLRPLLLFIFPVLALTSCIDSKTFLAQNGVLDATQWDFVNDGTITLNGEWEFYWNQLLDPEDFNANPKKSYIKLPGVWNDYKNEETTIPGEGYATFRLRIKSNLKNKALGLRIPFHFTAYKLWINQKQYAENGIVGKTQDTAIPQTLPRYIYFESSDDEINITLQVSNFHFFKGGAPAPYKLGLEMSVKESQTRLFATDLFLTGSLFIMAFYHLGLFILRKKEISTLYFSLACFLMMLRTICLSETFLIVLYPDFDFDLYISLVFLSLFLGPPLFVLFLEKLFPEESIARAGKIFLVLGILFSVSLLFPASVSSRASVPFLFILFFSLVYELYILVMAVLHRRDGALLAFAGMLVLAGTALNDILFDSQVIKTDYYAPYGLFLFIFIQSFLLSMKFSRAFASVEDLSVHIKQINKANSRFVPSEFLSFLGKESVVDVQLGDHVIKDMTIFFADIRSFTTISESMTPEENFDFINSLLKRISPIIRNNNGFVDKFMGDSIMALFPGDPKDAVLAASQVFDELELYNAARLRADLIPIRLGIGINAGTLMLGTIGEEERMEGTVISDSVNLASRLEGLTKIYGANVIVSENVLLNVKDILKIDYLFLGKVQVKGKAESVSIYDIFSFDSQEMKTTKLQIKEQFEEAVKLYQSNSFSQAKALFQNVLKLAPDLVSAQYYMSSINKEL